MKQTKETNSKHMTDSMKQTANIIHKQNSLYGNDIEHNKETE
jgi:hypothetical protein